MYNPPGCMALDVVWGAFEIEQAFWFADDCPGVAVFKARYIALCPRTARKKRMVRAQKTEAAHRAGAICSTARARRNALVRSSTQRDALRAGGSPARATGT
jgi:hypothetical protein